MAKEKIYVEISTIGKVFISALNAYNFDLIYLLKNVLKIVKNSCKKKTCIYCVETCVIPIMNEINK